MTDRPRVIPSMIGMLHDVDVSSTPPADGDTLTWDDTAKRWVPGSGGGFDPNEDPVIIGSGATAGTGTPSNPSGGSNHSVVIGYTANDASTYGNNVIIGNEALSNWDNCVVIGRNAASDGASAVSVGDGANAAADNAVAVGPGADAEGTASIAIGAGAGANGQVAISMAGLADNDYSIAIGWGGNAVRSDYGISIGQDATVGTTADNGVALGHGAQVHNSHANSAALGYASETTAANQVMLGSSLTHFVEVCQYDFTYGSILVMTSPDGTRWALQIDNSGNVSAIASPV